MLARATLTTTEQTLYTVPSGKKSSIVIILCNTDASSTVKAVVKISGDELLIVNLEPEETFQLTQLLLDENDNVSAFASVDNKVKLFISGLEEEE